MKEKKNIDRIFQEKFKDFEKEPREKIWDNIASKLDEKERKRPIIIPLWMKLGGVAAVITVVLASLLFTGNQESIPNEPGVVVEDADETREDETEKSNTPQKKEENSQTRVASQESDETNSAERNSPSREDHSSSSNNNSASDPAITNQNSENAKASAIRNPTNQDKQNRAIVSEETKNPETKNEKEKVAIKPEVINNETSGIIARAEETKKDSAASEITLKEENALAQVEDQNKNTENEEELAEEKSRKIRLSTFAAPIFYKNMGSGNELSSQLSNNPSSSEVTFSYGIKVAYELSEKIRIRTGISKVDVNYSIGDISYSPAAMAGNFENIRPVEENIQIRNNASSGPGNSFASESMNRNSLAAAIFTPGEINQQFGFIEVPLEIEYSLIDKKFGLNIIGGGSSLFLHRNRVALVSANSNTNLGEAANINSTSFSTNIGLGMDYKLNDRFSISLEPIFKYQINTFDNVENVQPVNFGIYSGLNLRF